ncbi:MAG: type I-MYXAN CRISPR-associated protein Cas6/Cmx6 [Burkholderiales bacterium]|nr:type I-MYXAN CRISPR-associated protein Cas6/Cmx6 [Burkholderiales bacterium]
MIESASIAAAPEAPATPMRADMLDLAFALEGHELPLAHRAALADALQRVLPWLDEGSGVAVHRLNVAAGGGPLALLSGRTRLTLRLPRARVADALALCGTTLEVAGRTLRVGAAQPRELLAFGTLFAHFVAADAEVGEGGEAAAGDEGAFLGAVQQELAALGVSARVICGRHQTLEDGTLGGYGLMLDGLGREDSRRVLERGLGPHRLWGCGVFVPHRSAAAVGQAA